MEKTTYVLNKPALLTSEESLLRFDGHDIVIPMAVLEDLQSSMTKLKSARQAIARKVLDILDNYDTKTLINKGVTLENGTLLKVSTNYNAEFVDADGISQKDRRILQTCLGLMREGKKVILISNNPIVRMKARQLDIVAEKLKDRVFPSRKDQYKGYANVITHDAAIDKLFETGYLNVEEIYDYDKIEWLTNLYLIIEGESSKSALGYFDGKKIVHIREQKYPYGVKPKNVKQRLLLHALMDEDTPLVIIKGNAGTGKTYCSLAAGLQKVQEEHVYEQILITKSTKKVDHEELGYLPGDINEKFDPYIDSIYDNLEMLYKPSKGKYDDNDDYGYERYMKKRNAMRGDYFDTGIIEIQTLGHIRGRSIAKRFFIIDETQNIDPESIKSIVSRAGQGSKFIFLGDPTQIDVPELSETYNGIVYLSEMMKGQSLCRQITLGGEKDTVRSPLAQLAVDILV